MAKVPSQWLVKVGHAVAHKHWIPPQKVWLLDGCVWVCLKIVENKAKSNSLSDFSPVKIACFWWYFGISTFFGPTHLAKLSTRFPPSPGCPCSQQPTRSVSICFWWGRAWSWYDWYGSFMIFHDHWKDLKSTLPSTSKSGTNNFPRITQIEVASVFLKNPSQPHSQNQLLSDCRVVIEKKYWRITLKGRPGRVIFSESPNLWQGLDEFFSSKY